MKPWQRGVPLDELRRIVSVFDAHDASVTFGRMARFNEAQAAEALSKDELIQGSGWALRARLARSAAQLKDFTGERVGTIPAGALVVSRLAFLGAAPPAELLRCLNELRAVGSLAVTLFQEHPGDRQLAQALGLSLAAVKIAASSELRGVYTEAPSSYAPAAADRAGICALQLEPLDVAPLAARLDSLSLDYAQHYSHYNVRGSWSALALRGFSDDPNFIAKPEEMSKAWKQAHAELLAEPCRWTSLSEAIPEARRLVEQLPGEPERVRLMRVQPGGALSRHADITDRSAGTRPGQVMRVHIPIRTSSSVVFSSWALSGAEEQFVMPQGQPCYLDVRKPHAAINGGADARVHLVADLAACSELRALLPCS